MARHAVFPMQYSSSILGATSILCGCGEMVDTQFLKICARKGVEVRVLSAAPNYTELTVVECIHAGLKNWCYEIWHAGSSPVETIAMLLEPL